MLSITREVPAPRDMARSPAEPGVWLLVWAELAVFMVLFAAFLTVWSKHPTAFAAAADTSLVIGTVNTVALLTSSALVATAVQAARQGKVSEARRYVTATAALGVGFLLLKSIEYWTELANGLTPATNPFWMYYYAITGLHATHVLMGLGALTFAYRCLSGPAAHSARSLQHLESSAVYWHMVDLLWIVIFPLVYLAPR